MEKREKMQNFKKRTMATLIALFLISIFGVSLGAVPAANAHTPSWTIPSFPHIYAATDPIGVGQQAYIYMFLCPTYPDEAITNDYRFHNYQLIITSPSGKVTNQNFPVCQDPTSNQGTTFVPDEVGVYNLTFVFPGQNVNDYSHLSTSAYINDTFMAGTASTTLTVQQEPIQIISVPPLPTAYWTRPIFGTNTAWSVVTSNWLGSGMPGFSTMTAPNLLCFSGQSVGSLTSHIMWTKSIGQPGGLVGGELTKPGETWFEGTAYSQRYTNPIIVAGMLVYKEPFETTGTAGDTVCVNLYTGEELWRSSTVPTFSFAYVQDMNNPDFHGARSAYLCTSSFALWDAATGKNVMNATGVPSGTTWIGPTGEVMKYIIYNNGTTAAPDYYLCLWNSSRWWSSASMGERSFVTNTTTTTTNVTSTTYVNGVLTTTLTPTTTTTVTVPANKAYMYETLNPTTQNMSIPWRNGQAGSPTILAALPGDLMLCRNGSYPSNPGPTGNPTWNYFAVNLNASKGVVGSVLWWNTAQPAIDAVYGNITTISLAAGVSFAGATQSGFAEAWHQTQQIAFYNIRTGAFIKLSDSQPALDYYGSTSAGTLNTVAAFDRLYAGAYAGVTYCYDMKTGKLLWTYGNGGEGNSTYSGFEVPGHYPTFVNAIGGHDLSDGVVYTITTEHTFETPIYKGATTRAMNASDGREIYVLQAATGEFGAGSFAIADGYTNLFNSYDQRIYTLGRGPSVTTVQAPLTDITAGDKVVIQGTVMDVSVGLQTTEIKGRFPAGVPVCADRSMEDWMGYVYQQQPLPTNFTGVSVSIDAIDPNGNFVHIGTATSDWQGVFHSTWTPPNIPGEYAVMATFVGTNGYWPSYAETNMVISSPQPSPSPTPTPVAAPLPPYETYILLATVVIVIAIAIVGLMLYRKHP
jgi:hypothetical protein